MVPGLEFVEESLQYYEQKLGCHIVRYPGPSCYRTLNNTVYQPKDHQPQAANLLPCARLEQAAGD